MIQLRVPCSLSYRNIVLGVVAEACNVIHAPESEPFCSDDLDEDFKRETVTAVGEAFNNIAIHGYAGRKADVIEVQIEPLERQVVVRLLDNGRSFDPGSVPEPELDALPERGMGLFIIKSFMDDVSYYPGSPNVLALTKTRALGPARAHEAQGAGGESPAGSGAGTEDDEVRTRPAEAAPDAVGPKAAEKSELRPARRGSAGGSATARPRLRPRREPQEG